MANTDNSCNCKQIKISNYELAAYNYTHNNKININTYAPILAVYHLNAKTLHDIDL